MDSIYWLLLFLILLVIEVLTMGLTTIWFAGGSLAAFIVSLILGDMLEIEVAVFVIVSVVLLLFTRPWAMRYLNRRTTRTNVDSLIGSIVRVTELVDNIMEKGAAQAEGKTWTARAEEDGITFVPGELAVVKEIRGVKLILRKKKED
ncbi:MAG: NfeD family protein [Lachnospiraceae bacterium]|nr:NfeD family protein [Lachnospiraceae bacterium]